jgi:hypothetical protein
VQSIFHYHLIQSHKIKKIDFGQKKKISCSTLSEFEKFLLCERSLIMLQLVKTKRQANFKDFKRFGALRGSSNKKNVVFNSFLCKLGL